MPKVPKVILRIDTSRMCGRGILRGIARYCRLYCHWRLSQKPPFYLYSDDDSSRLENWVADGMIVEQPLIPKEVMEIGVPIIGIDVIEQIPDLPNIVADDDAIAAMAVEYFRSRGFCYFAYCGFEDIHWAQARGESFFKKISETEFQLHTYKQKQTLSDRYTWDEELLLLIDWLKTLPKPTGLLACNDDFAKQVNTACQMADLRVPDDIAILGVDNDEMICLPSDPPLSSIVLNFERAGFEAAELLDKMMRGEEPTEKVIIFVEPTHVVTRHSTDILGVSDPQLAEALRFIREHAHDIIQVADVAKAAAMSRRILEDRFRKIVGRSINTEIRRVRTDRIAQLLTETDLSISQIALKLGYTDVEHIARYFRTEKGLSPLEFRKKYGKKQ